MRKYALFCTVLLLCAFLDLLGRFSKEPYYIDSFTLETFSEEVKVTEKPHSIEDTPAFLDSVMKEGKITDKKTLSSDKGEILRYDVSLNRGRRRVYLFPDGSIFLCEKSGHFSVSFDGYGKITPLSENPLTPVVITGKNGSVVVQPPLARATALFEGQNFIMGGVSGGEVSVKNEKTVNISFDGALCDWWMYYTPEIVSDISPLTACAVEKFGVDNRMTLDGYYYESPPLYTPSGDYLFYRIPAPHIAVKLVTKPEAEVFKSMGIGMLDIQRGCLNSDGYIPTPSLCTWLYEDYGVGHDFYDTRFNTDFARAMLLSGVDELKKAAEKYADFFIEYAKTHKYETENGILVEDYSHPLGNDKTNASLNHNAAEILFLLDTEKEEAKLVAEKMLRGIEDTADSWIMEDKNLNYAIYPDKSFGGQDYIYLTYNDLLALDRKIGGNEYLQP